MDDFENMRLNFSPESLQVLNIAISIMVFGVSLGIKKEHFSVLFRQPKPVLTGVFSQFVLLPALTFVIILIFKPTTSIALGMILVAACPGGSVSNLFTAFSKGNVALSISLTAIATFLAVFMTPFNFSFWASLLPETPNPELFSLSFSDLFQTILFILALPLAIGLLFSNKFPTVAKKIEKPINIFSFFVLIAVIIIAFTKNSEYFKPHIWLVFWLVLIHNAVAFLSAFSLGKLLRNSKENIISITIETGIQNSALALIIIFSFFNGNGPMSFVAAWWGIWHIVAGSVMVLVFRRLY